MTKAKFCDRWPVLTVGVTLTIWAVIALIFWAIPGNARADAVFSNARGTLRVLDRPCPAAIATQAPMGSRGYYRFAVATMKDGAKFAACAALATLKERKGIQVHVMYDDGTSELIPYSEFRDEEPEPTTPTLKL